MNIPACVATAAVLVLTASCSNSGGDATTERVAFAEPREALLPTPTAPLPTGLGFSVGDFDGDGRADVLVTQSYASAPSERTLYLGGVEGLRLANRPIPPLSSATIVDLDRDGRPDLVGCGPQGPAVALGTAGGGWTTPVTVMATNGCRGAVVADFDGDGKLDLAFGNGVSAAPVVNVWRGSGDGRFSPWTTVPLEGLSDFAVVLVHGGDFNGDGKPDLLVQARRSLFEPNRIQVLLGSGDGRFQKSWPSISEPSEWTRRTLDIVYVADLDGDGRSDILVIASNDFGAPIVSPAPNGAPPALPTIAQVLIARADGSMSPLPPFPFDGTLARPVDMNGDGIADVVSLQAGASGQAGSTLSLFLGRGDGTFADAVVAASPAKAYRGTLMIGDVDGDGRPDVVVGTDTSLVTFLKR